MLFLFTQLSAVEYFSVSTLLVNSLVPVILELREIFKMKNY